MLCDILDAADGFVEKQHRIIADREGMDAREASVACGCMKTNDLADLGVSRHLIRDAGCWQLNLVGRGAATASLELVLGSAVSCDEDAVAGWAVQIVSGTGT